MVGVKRKAEESFGDGAVWERGLEIGRGAFGSVFVGKVRPSHKKRNRDWPESIALKSAKLLDSDSLMNEIEVFEDLMCDGGCPFIVQCYGHEITTSEAGENIFNLMLEIAKASLSNHLSINGMPEHLVRLYTRNILQGVKHIHDCGYVHCDIKPQNILLVENQNKDGGAVTYVAKVADLGLAKKKNSTFSGSQGTWIYLSPEALREDDQEQPSDIWAVGCVVLQMLTGLVSPRDAFYYWLQDEEEDDDPKIRISEDASDFLKHCLDFDSDERWTADKLLSHPFVEAGCTKSTYS